MIVHSVILHDPASQAEEELESLQANKSDTTHLKRGKRFCSYQNILTDC